jgi:hypothetical protein
MKRIVFFLIGSILLSQVSCLKEESAEFKFPKLVIDPVSSITPDGARFSAKIDYANIKEITEYGFEWSKNSNLAGSTIVISPDVINSNDFYVDIRSNLVSQTSYYVRAYVKKSGKTVYSSIVGFKSLGSEGPKITDIVPQLAAFGDTVRVIGKNFTSNARLSYGTQDITKSILKIEKSKITFVLPSYVNDSPPQNTLTVSIEGNGGISPIPLKLDMDRIRPKITSISPMSLKACDTVIIRGNNLVYENGPIYLTDSENQLTVLEATKEKVVAVLRIIPKNGLLFYLYNGRYSAFSTNIDLTELRPEVVSVSPLVYKPNEIITVKVKNFPYCDNSIYASFNGNFQNIPILSKTKDQVVLQLPEGCFGDFRILFTFPAYTSSNYQTVLTPVLTPEAPVITSIEPSHGSFGDMIIIKGSNLMGAATDLLDVITTSTTEIQGRLTQSGVVKENGLTDVVVYNCGVTTKVDAFTYDPVEILDFNPKIITSRSQKITITGNNFSSAGYTNTVTFGSYQTTVSSTDNHTLIVPVSDLIPDFTVSVNELVSITVKNNVGKETTSFVPLEFNCDASWVRMSDFPFELFYFGTSFSLNGKGYMCQSNGNLLQYDPSIDVWVPKAVNPGHPDSYKKSAVANGKAYVGLGANFNKEWWEYDPLNDVWTQKKDFPGTYSIAGFAFEINGKIYVGGGSGTAWVNEFWEYNPATDVWTRKVNVPTFNTSGQYAFSFKGKGYFYATLLNGIQYECVYDPLTNNWKNRPINTFERGGNTIYFVFNDYVIVGGESIDQFNKNVLLKIVPGSGNFEPVEFAGGYRRGQIGFAIGNYGYWGLGVMAGGSSILFDIWRFDPSKFMQ